LQFFSDGEINRELCDKDDKHLTKQILVQMTKSAVTGLFALGLAANAAAAAELTVYTAVEAEDLKAYAEKFNESNPDIKINWVRDSTGIITAKLLAEKDNPQADVVWGLAATSLMLLKAEGMTQPYAPAGVEALDKRFVDSAKPPHWTGGLLENKLIH